MLSAISFLIKFVLFSVFVLIVGNWASWHGKSLNDHLRASISHAERSDAATQVRDWTRKITDDARGGFEKKSKTRSHATHAFHRPAQESSDIVDRTETQAAAPSNQELHADASSSEQIPSSERQKLRALIRELNSSHGKD